MAFSHLEQKEPCQINDLRIVGTGTAAKVIHGRFNGVYESWIIYTLSAFARFPLK